MKLAVVLASVRYHPAGARAEQERCRRLAEQTGKKEHAHGLVIRVADGGGVTPSLEEIETLLYAVAAEMLSHFPAAGSIP
jgi:hypothetical protein